MSSTEHGNREFELDWSNLCDVIERHLGKTGEDAEWWADRLMSHGLLNGFAHYVIEKPKALGALDRLDSALRELSLAFSEAAIDHATRARLTISMMYGPFFGVASRNLEDQSAIKSFFNTTGGPRFRAFSEVMDNIAEYRECIKLVRANIENDTCAVRTLAQLNAPAINLVSGCRWVWENATGKPAPSKGLKPTSKFGAFLEDSMEAFQVDGKPRPAFLAWVRYVGKYP